MPGGLVQAARRRVQIQALRRGASIAIALVAALAAPTAGFAASAGSPAQMTLTFRVHQGGRTWTQTIAWDASNRTLARSSDGFVLLYNGSRSYMCADSTATFETGRPARPTSKPHVCAQGAPSNRKARTAVEAVVQQVRLALGPRGMIGGEVPHPTALPGRTIGGVASSCVTGADVFERSEHDTGCVATDGGYLTYYRQGSATWQLQAASDTAARALFTLPPHVRVLSAGASRSWLP
jgi:hypothetical protein